MIINRVWAMPDKNTFMIKPVKDLIVRLFIQKATLKKCVAVDPFVGHSPFAGRCQFTNDLNIAIEATSHEDAHDFLKTLPDTFCDMVLFDPPYSPRQVSESYKKFDRSVNMQTTQASYWTRLKEQIARITKDGAIVISCGWNSGGIGINNGFEITEVLLVPHGGWHNDTIVTVEKKTVIQELQDAIKF